MKSKPAFHLILLTFTSMCLLLCLTSKAYAADEADLTLMVYMCGSNLESGSGAASADLMEMASSGYDFKRMNVLVMTGGTEYWTLGLPTDSLCIYMPGRGTLRMMEAYEGESMGTPGPLAQLLNYGYAQYPAKRYALILWDHGGGPLRGVCMDEQYDSDTLSMEELCAALSASPAAEEKLEWIGFDACLMGSAEVASLMAPYAKYMIASEETEPGGGWDYSVLASLSPEGQEAGKQIVDSYFDAAQDPEKLTLSCTDLSAIADLNTCMDELFPSLEISSGNYAMYSFTAGNTRSFGKSVDSSDGYDLLDLASLIHAFETQAPEAAGKTLDALDKAVLYSRSGSESGGLSVYHPYANKNEYVREWSELYAQLGFSPGYAGYISRFASYLFGKAAASWADLSALPTDEADVFALPLTSEQQSMYASAVMNILQWNPQANVYSNLCSINNLNVSEGTLYGAVSDSSLCVVGPDAETVICAIPYETFEDGSVGAYVNFCKEGTSTSAEASALVAVDTGGLRKDLGSYSFELDDVSTSGMSASGSSGSSSGGSSDGSSADSSSGGSSGGSSNGSSGGSSGGSSLGSSNIGGTLSDVSSDSLADRLGSTSVLTQAVSPLAAEDQAKIKVPETISLAASNSTPVISSGSGSLFSLFGEEHAQAQITPVQASSLQMSTTLSSGQVGSSVDVSSLVPIGTDCFSPDQVVIAIDQLPVPEGEEERQADVIHGWVKGTVLEDGSIRILETWLYDERSGLWSTRGALDTALYTEAAFPISWKTPVFQDDSLTGFSSWEESHTTCAGTAGQSWSLRFQPNEADPEKGTLCVCFEVTDTQDQTHSSLPLQLGD